MNSIFKANTRVTLVQAASLITLCAISACGSDDKINETLAPVHEQVKEAKKNIVESDTRQEFEASMNKRLEELRSEINDMEKARDSEPVVGTRRAIALRVDDANSLYANLDREFTDFKRKTEGEWKIGRDAIEKSYKSAQSEVKLAIERNKDEKEIQRKLNRINSKIAALKTDLTTAADDAKEKLKADIKKLEKSNEELSDKFSQLRESSKEKWDTLKQGLNDAFDSLSTAFKDIFS